MLLIVKKMPKQSRQSCARLYYVLTKNNPTTQDLEDIKKLPYKYLVYQVEVGENTGTRHIQGYVALKKAMRITALNKVFKAHYEARLGTHQEAKDYCMKDDTRVEGPWELGSDTDIAKTPGKRTDLDNVKEILDSGQLNAIKQVQNEHFGAWCRYYKAFDIYANQRTAPRDPNKPPKVLIFWGDRGTGKSRKAYQLAPPPGAYWLTKPADPNQVWFDGYQAGQALVIDEFYGWIKYDFMLRLIDRYPMDVKIHGSKIVFNSPLIIITSNKDPRTWYGYKKDTDNAGEMIKDPYFDTSAWERRLDTFCTIFHYQIGMPEPEIPDVTGIIPESINSSQFTTHINSSQFDEVMD